MKPKIDFSNTPTKFQRPHAENQQTSTAMRPPLPRDASQNGRPYWSPGELPKGGYQSVWCFDGSGNTKKSPTQVKEKKVY